MWVLGSWVLWVPSQEWALLNRGLGCGGSRGSLGLSGGGLLRVLDVRLGVWVVWVSSQERALLTLDLSLWVSVGLDDRVVRVLDDEWAGLVGVGLGEGMIRVLGNKRTLLSLSLSGGGCGGGNSGLALSSGSWVLWVSLKEWTLRKSWGSGGWVTWVPLKEWADLTSSLPGMWVRGSGGSGGLLGALDVRLGVWVIWVLSQEWTLLTLDLSLRVSMSLDNGVVGVLGNEWAGLVGVGLSQRMIRVLGNEWTLLSLSLSSGSLLSTLEMSLGEWMMRVLCQVRTSLVRVLLGCVSPGERMLWVSSQERTLLTLILSSVISLSLSLGGIIRHRFWVQSGLTKSDHSSALRGDHRSLDPSSGSLRGLSSLLRSNRESLVDTSSSDKSASKSKRKWVVQSWALDVPG